MTTKHSKKFIIIGAGFSGSFLARKLVDLIPSASCVILEKRNHIAGNCYTSRDSETNVMVHHHGPHIFNTNNKSIWDLVNEITPFMPFINRVKANTDNGMFALPINLLTINQLFGKTLNPIEAEAFIKSIAVKYQHTPNNLEEQALSMVGKDIYETFFKGYTIKQWGSDPRQLPADVIKRIPLRFNYDDNYYNKTYQGMPRDGYTKICEVLLDHPRIETRLNSDFTYDNWENTIKTENAEHIFYSGPIDAFFGFKFGRLAYRTVTFEKEVLPKTTDYQGCGIINYPKLSVPYTRILEHKHLAPWEKHEGTIVHKEFSKETSEKDDPYYPKRLAEDKIRLADYKKKAENTDNVSFLGRLATYRYMDMDKIIEEATSFGEACAKAILSDKRIPTFPTEEA